MKEEQTTLVRRSEPSWFVVRWTLQLAYFIPSHRQGIPLAAQTIHDVLVLYDHFWNEGHDGEEKKIKSFPRRHFCYFPARVLNHQISRHVSLFFSCSAVTRYRIIKSRMLAVFGDFNFAFLPFGFSFFLANERFLFFFWLDWEIFFGEMKERKKIPDRK
jgi:hypothetical protein